MNSPIESPRTILARHRLRPKKSWGQNFLSDAAILDRIARLAHVGPGDVVVELGAGMGHLTRALAETGAQIVAVERDRDLVKVLETELRLPNVQVVGANATAIDFAAVAGTDRPTVVGNLPYQLSGRILFGIYEQHASVRRAVFTLQREVADRITSGPGSRDYGILSVLLQTVGTVERAFDIPAGAFHPAPKVDSCVVCIELRPVADLPDLDMQALARVVKAAFASRRKTLANTLSASRIASRAMVATALAQAGIDGTRRAETLAPSEFGALTTALSTVFVEPR
jgi:16S rRNA (adenine1518-N6/adenine1519-N6)-dimethyltransferase